MTGTRLLVELTNHTAARAPTTTSTVPRAYRPGRRRVRGGGTGGAIGIDRSPTAGAAAEAAGPDPLVIVDITYLRHRRAICSGHEHLQFADPHLRRRRP